VRALLASLSVIAVLWASPAPAQKLPEYAAGMREVLNYAPELPEQSESENALKQILARPEFLESEARPPGPTLLQKIVEWILRHLPSGLGNLEGAGRVAAAVAAVVIGVLLVLLIYTLVRAVWLRLSLRLEAREMADEAQLDAAGLLQLAAKSAAAGAYQAALRYRFKAVVGELGELNSERRTNWQLLRHVRREHPRATTDFAALVALFEDCWYGGQVAGAEEYSRADELARSVEAQLIPREEAA
jgi:hypothetical protein